MGSFCSAVLPMLPPRLAKLVLCGIVCRCEDAAIALATALAEEQALIDCAKNMIFLKELVKVQSEHLAILHAYDRRYGNTRTLFPNYDTIKSMERREWIIRRRIKKEPVKIRAGSLDGNEEMEKRMLCHVMSLLGVNGTGVNEEGGTIAVALAMAFGDRIGFAPVGGGNGKTLCFHLYDPDNGEEKFKFETSTKFPASEEEAGVYYQLREKGNGPRVTAEVTFLPVAILGAIGNIGGKVEKSSQGGLALTTNTGGLHVKTGNMDDVEEMMEMREEVRMEVQRVALSYLQPDRYLVQFKTERDQWMEELFPLLTHSR